MELNNHNKKFLPKMWQLRKYNILYIVISKMYRTKLVRFRNCLDMFKVLEGSFIQYWTIEIN